MGLNLKGRNWGDLVNWDDLGRFYTGFIVVWTVLLYSGVVWLFFNRTQPVIKIRNLPLAAAAISFLHIYLVKILLAYITNGHFTCAAEFWIMSIYLPFGIALFQANLAQLRSINNQQRSFCEPSFIRSYGFRKRWQDCSYLTKTYVLLGIGMAFQLAVTGALYATTPTLRGDWSSYGKLSHAKGQAKCRKSPEWIPSAFWQLFYSWCYGPYMLFKIRNIRDTHYWRLQVILSVISGLPGAPLWLAAVFSTRFKVINRRWVPPMWLAPGIIIMQFVTIFFPIYDAVKSRNLHRETLSTIKEWEDRRYNSAKHLIAGSDSRDSRQLSSQDSTLVSSRRNAYMHTMAGLEKTLAGNPEPLLRFAATRDFTAENITFLMQVRHWRGAFLETSKRDGQTSDQSDMFIAAMQIYLANVNEKTCEFPINIESRIRHGLDTVFAGAMPDGLIKTTYRYCESLLAKPSMAHESSGDSAETLYFDMKLNLPQLVQTTNMEHCAACTFPQHPAVAPLGRARAKVPVEFGEHVFDAAEQSIKYLVLTNTWQKFVGSHKDDSKSAELSP